MRVLTSESFFYALDKDIQATDPSKIFDHFFGLAIRLEDSPFISLQSLKLSQDREETSSRLFDGVYAFFLRDITQTRDYFVAWLLVRDQQGETCSKCMA